MYLTKLLIHLARMGLECEHVLSLVKIISSFARVVLETSNFLFDKVIFALSCMSLFSYL
jgi:hypothetical protein